MFILDSKPLALDRAFTHNGVQYPANWLRLASPAEREAIGITEAPDPEPYDKRFFWKPDLPKDHTQLVEQWVGQTKTTAGTLLAPTDWMITRSAEPGGKPASDEVLAQRAAIRTKSDEKETAILATITTEELAAYITGPDYPVWTEPESTEVTDSTQVS
jgi:hypothetical protein